MIRFLVDRRGVVSPVERGIRNYIHHRLPQDADIVTYAVRDLGVIEVALAPYGARVRLRPRLVSQRALSTALFMLADEAPRRFVLAHYERSWREELVPTFPTLVERIQELVSGVRSRHPGKVFHAEERPIDPTASIIARPFAELIEEWRARRGILPEDATRPFRRVGCLGRTTLVAAPSGSRLTIAFRGRGLTHYGRAGWTQYIGRPVDEQPDADYSSAASAAYGRVVGEAAPLLESCEGTIAAPSGLGRRSIYDRLLLPWRAAGGEPMVSGVSLLRGRTEWRKSTKPVESASSSLLDIHTQEMSKLVP
ncbi:MAG: hypothetical protein IT561_11880 [Alphaproteobacteria bacterium]|nr:hypothetical protein [Alphaproteobacteria bacterium]